MSNTIGVSDQFLAAVRGSHSMISLVKVLEPPGQTGAGLIGRALAVVGGTVTLDGTAAIRASVDLTVAEGWPTNNTVSDLVPFGTEIVVSRGVRYTAGSSESVQLGVFRITDSEQNEVPSGTVRITGSDRMGSVIDQKLEKPRYFQVGLTYEQIFNGLNGDDGLITELGLTAPTWDDTGSVTGSAKALARGLVCEEDRFAFLDELVRGVGKIWYFDNRGLLQIKNPPSQDVPVFDVNAGENGVLVSASRVLTRSNVYNIIVVTGEGLGGDVLPVVTTARDTDPDSVTYWLGPFGKVPLQISGADISNLTQAQAAADMELLIRKGLPYSVDFTQVPNPALEPLDAVQVVYPLDRVNSPHVRTEFHVLNQLTIGLGPTDGMSCATRLTSNRGVRV